MIQESIQDNYTSSKYYQFYSVGSILEHVIECFHTIVTDENNPCRPLIPWLSWKQPKPLEDEIFHDLFDECSSPPNHADNGLKLSSSVKTRIERLPESVRKAIVSKTKDGCSPLFIACKQGHLNIVKYLIETCGADIEQKGLYEHPDDHHVHTVSPLWLAAVSGNLSIVDLLIHFGSDVNSLSDTGSTPLRSTCYMCNDDTEQQGSIMVNLDSNSCSTGDEYFSIVKLLVENGANISIANFNGGTCLINSVHSYSLCKYLIANGAEVNALDHQSRSPLHYAIQIGRLEVIRLLISFGADPFIRSESGDDALQLSCLKGHQKVFDFLLQNFDFPRWRVVDAYKLLGSSILDVHFDVPRVRALWLKSLELNGNINHDSMPSKNESISGTNRLRDIRRTIAFGDIKEFWVENELQSLSMDEFRIQCLLINERIIGSTHRENIQRLLYRGTLYINSLRPDCCLGVWIYAFGLRLQLDSIMNLESLIAAQAISKLFLDLLGKAHPIRFNDLHDFLLLLVNQLDDCKRSLAQRPVSCFHQERFNLVLEFVVNILITINYESRKTSDLERIHTMVRKLVMIDPRSSNGSSLLHICTNPRALNDDRHRLLIILKKESLPIIELIDLLIGSGFDIDSTDNNNLTALQVLCSATCRLPGQRSIIKHMIEVGAHVDRRALEPDLFDLIQQNIREAGVNPNQHMKLSCLAARKLVESKIAFDERIMPCSLKNLIAIH